MKIKINTLFYYGVCLFFVVLFFYIHNDFLNSMAQGTESLVKYLLVSKNTNYSYADDLENNIEEETHLLSAELLPYINHFKKGKDEYPSNFIKYFFTFVNDIQPYYTSHQYYSDSLILYKLEVPGNEPFKIDLSFKKQGDKYLLSDISNFSAIFERLNCQGIKPEQLK